MSCGKWAPLKLIAIVSLLLYSMGWRGEHTPNRLKRKLATEPREYRPGVSFGALVACGPQLRSVRIRPRLPGFGPGGDPVGPAPEADRGTLPGSPPVRILLTVPFDEHSSGPADLDWRTRPGQGRPL